MPNDASRRNLKNRLYGQFARIGRALASPHRLELIELLAEGEHTVEALAAAAGISAANASQHLQGLREVGLVESRKQGLFVHYRLADPEVVELTRKLRTVAGHRLAEIDRLVRQRIGDRLNSEPAAIEEFIERAIARDRLPHRGADKGHTADPRPPSLVELGEPS
jgi:DNA-binding transcriptional ArsR family regulator